MSPRSRTSAGILMFRRRGDKIEFLLAHPGGPLFVHKDKGHWTIPKGEAAPGEDLLTRARIEFAEEVGLEPMGPYLPLGTIKQKGGKIVHAWAVEGDLPPGFVQRPTLSSWSGHHAPARCKVSRKLIARNSLPKNCPQENQAHASSILRLSHRRARLVQYFLRARR